MHSSVKGGSSGLVGRTDHACVSRPHCAEVVGVVEQVARHIGGHVLLAPHLHQPLHVRLQLGRPRVVHHLTLCVQGIMQWTLWTSTSQLQGHGIHRRNQVLIGYLKPLLRERTGSSRAILGERRGQSTLEMLMLRRLASWRTTSGWPRSTMCASPLGCQLLGCCQHPRVPRLWQHYALGLQAHDTPVHTRCDT